MNTPTLQTRDLAITTLSPVHIGCGDTLDPTGYVIDGDTLYQFDPSAALAALGPEQRSELLAITSGAPNIAMLKKAQQFFDRHREPLIAAAGHWMPVSPAIAEEYHRRIGKAANIERDGKQVINSLEIQQCFRNPISRQPIIPGSSIKGAIRTALLDAVNDGKPLSQADKRGHDRSWNTNLQERLFNYDFKHLEKDPMRLILIADAPYSGPDDVNPSEVLFAVNRKRHPVRKNGELLKSQAEKQNLSQRLECLPPLRQRSLCSRLTIQSTDGLDRHSDKLPARELRWDAHAVAKHCNEFYFKQLRREVEALKKRGYLDSAWREAVESLMSGELARRIADHQAFVLRVGFHSGAESVTLNGLRNIKIMQGKDERGRNRPPQFADKPKTWWLASTEQGDQRSLIPFGWVIIELLPADQSPPPWPEADRLLGPSEESGRAWAARQRQHRETLQAEQQQRRQQAVIEEQEHAASEAAKQAEAARLAALSPQALELDRLRRWFQQDRDNGIKQAGGRLSNKLSALLPAAGDWPKPERLELADLAEDIYKYLGWGKKNKRELKRRQIAAMRED